MNRVYVAMQDGVEEPAWLEAVEPFVQKALSELKFDGEEISMLFCNDTYMQELNKTYRNIDSTTDVLSFENGDEYEDEAGESWFAAGDIVISLDTLMTNCKEFNETPDNELKRLLVHGVLHLKGMDHSDNSPEQEMLVFQEDFLKKLNYKQIIIGNL